MVAAGRLYPGPEGARIHRFPQKRCEARGPAGEARGANVPTLLSSHPLLSMPPVSESRKKLEGGKGSWVTQPLQVKVEKWSVDLEAKQRLLR